MCILAYNFLKNCKQTRNQPRNQLQGQLTNYFAGQQWLDWQYYYKFTQKIGVKYNNNATELLDEWILEVQNLHWWFPYKGAVLISERPIRLNVNESGQLHDENQKAIEYSDGWGFYYLNGVSVPEKLVTTPTEKLSVDFYKKEKNADIKAEFIRKFGVERMLDVGKKIEVRETLKIANSETTGNHHLVENIEGCEFYELDGVRYMKNSNPTNVKCVLTDRHDTFEIPAGTWEFGTQKEYDPFTARMQNVRD